jgi:hypothetical protein
LLMVDAPSLRAQRYERFACKRKAIARSKGGC